MSFKEKSLLCIDCKKNFIFSAEEQQFHASRGFPNVPRRCPLCRERKKGERAREQNASEDYSPLGRYFR